MNIFVFHWESCFANQYQQLASNIRSAQIDPRIGFTISALLCFYHRCTKQGPCLELIENKTECSRKYRFNLLDGIAVVNNVLNRFDDGQSGADVCAVPELNAMALRRFTQLLIEFVRFCIGDLAWCYKGNTCFQKRKIMLYGRFRYPCNRLSTTEFAAFICFTLCVKTTRSDCSLLFVSNECQSVRSIPCSSKTIFLLLAMPMTLICVRNAMRV